MQIWNFKPNFKCSPLNFFSGGPRPGLWCALASLGQSLERLKIWGAGTTRGRNTVSRKVDLGGSKHTCSTFWIVDQSSLDLFCRTRKESLSITYLSDFYPRDAMLARVIAIATSVCLFVCLSVTCQYCVKTKKASGMISSPSGSPKTLVFFWRQIWSPNSKGFPPSGGASNKCGVGKFSDFLALSVNISKTVADTAKVTISD